MKTATLLVIFLVGCGGSDAGPDSTGVDAAPHADAAQGADAALPDGMPSACSLVNVAPANGAVDVGPTPFVILGFSCCLESDSLVDVNVFDQAGEARALLNIFEDDCTALVLTVDTALEPLTTYTITAPGGPSGIRGREGESMADDFESTFSTGP